MIEIVGDTQSIWPPTAVTACGFSMFCVSETLGCETQLLAGLVTTIVYAPGNVTCTVVLVVFVKPPGPFHAKVAPGVLIVAVSVIESFAHVRMPAPTNTTSGVSLFSATVVVAVEVQPFGAVIVTVYIPAFVTSLGFCRMEE